MNNLTTRLELDGNRLIEASAGTGKTYTITNLVLRLLLGRDVPWDRPLGINEILILTFTIAATEELKHRISKRINEARLTFKTGEGDPDLLSLVASSKDQHRDLKLLAAAGQLMDEASIFTIHGFCARVLGEQAFESGALFSQALNAERDELLKLAAEDCFRSLIQPLPTDIRQVALDIWPSPEKIAVRYVPIMARGEFIAYPEDTGSDYDLLISNAIEVKARWQADDLEALLLGHDLHKGRRPYKRLAEMAAFCQAPGAGLTSELWQIYGSDGLASGFKKDVVPPEHPVLALIDEISHGATAIRASLWHQVVNFMQRTVANYKVEHNKMTLDDLLTNLASAINREHSPLPGTLRRRWPVAMIDEFQDTDAIQYSIFDRVYPAASPVASDTANLMLMIGDPKQAIYNFRGADIFTYINARRSATGRETLDTNWRSSADYIAATNLLFDKPDIFGNDADIPFNPVQPSAENQTMALKLSDTPLPPYQLFVSDQASTNSAHLDDLMAHAADETVSLLQNPGLSIDEKPIDAGQIAFLVRSRAHARAAKKALATRNIRSVYLTMDSVFLQDTAADLKLILEAVAEPNRDQAIRAALATRLMQGTAEDIDRLGHDIEHQQAVLAEFQGYHDLWQQRSLATMLNNLLERRSLATRWLGQPDGERQLTNLRHLMEILQQRADVVPGIRQLLNWFEQEQLTAGHATQEERQLRLESDENLVKIVTMHAAKGLEYDIVMLPMPVFSSPRADGRDPLIFHEERHGEFVTAVDYVGSADHQKLSRREAADEDMRLLYVALTRARYRCYLGLPTITGLKNAAVARLLEIDAVDDLATELRARLSPALFEVVTAQVSREEIIPAAGNTTLIEPPAKPIIPDTWRIHSYTGIAARLTSVASHPGPNGFSDDDESRVTVSPNTAHPATPERTRHTFPRGPAVGIVLHGLLEDIDFAEGNLGSTCASVCRRLDLDEHWAPVLEDWLNDILQTPLDSASPIGRRLSGLTQADRLDELEFHFPLSVSGGLLAFLQTHRYVGPGNTSQRGQEINHLEGLMTGMIDLVFRESGKFYIVDYKSNFLGPTAEDYAQTELAAAMDHHQYHLQHLIYSVALHRMLALKLPDYDYNTHFGGTYYLFLRGMDGSSQQGVYSTRPTREIVIELDRLLGATG